MTAEEKMAALGIFLPVAPKPVANYIPAVQVGDLLFTSGMLPIREGKLIYEGKLGNEVTLEQGREAARIALLNALSVVREDLGSLDAVLRVVRLTGHVASAAGFTQQPAVLNGASDLLVDLFGETGRHTRVALGAAELPLNSPVELELLLQVRI